MKRSLKEVFDSIESYVQVVAFELVTLEHGHGKRLSARGIETIRNIDEELNRISEELESLRKQMRVDRYD